MTNISGRKIQRIIDAPVQGQFMSARITGLGLLNILHTPRPPVWDRIIGDDLSLVPNHLIAKLANQVDADATLDTRLAEAERERDDFADRLTVAEEKLADFARLREKLAEAERGLDVCDCCAGPGVPVSGPGCICGGKGTALAERQGLRAELARLRPLAAEAEAWEKIRNHPMRDKDHMVGLDDDLGWWVYAKGGRGPTYAPTAVALLVKLDALVKPEPGVWRWRWPSGGTSAVTWESVDGCRDACAGQSGYPAREVVGPNGVVTLLPEGVEP